MRDDVFIWSLRNPNDMELRIVVAGNYFFYGYGLYGKVGGWTSTWLSTPEEARAAALTATQLNEQGGGVLDKQPRVRDFKGSLPPMDGPNAHQVAEYLYRSTLSLGKKLTA